MGQYEFDSKLHDTGRRSTRWPRSTVYLMGLGLLAVALPVACTAGDRADLARVEQAESDDHPGGDPTGEPGDVPPAPGEPGDVVTRYPCDAKEHSITVTGRAPRTYTTRIPADTEDAARAIRCGDDGPDTAIEIEGARLAVEDCRSKIPTVVCERCKNGEPCGDPKLTGECKDLKVATGVVTDDGVERDGDKFYKKCKFEGTVLAKGEIGVTCGTVACDR